MAINIIWDMGALRIPITRPQMTRTRNPRLIGLRNAVHFVLRRLKVRMGTSCTLKRMGLLREGGVRSRHEDDKHYGVKSLNVSISQNLNSLALLVKFFVGRAGKEVCNWFRWVFLSIVQ
jgi:hypothetical protein